MTFFFITFVFFGFRFFLCSGVLYCSPVGMQRMIANIIPSAVIAIMDYGADVNT